MMLQHCVHLSTVTLRIGEMTVQVAPSKSWRRGTETSDVMSIAFVDDRMSSSHHMTYSMRKTLQGVG